MTTDGGASNSRWNDLAVPTSVFAWRHGRASLLERDKTGICARWEAGDWRRSLVTATYITDRAQVINLRFDRSAEPIGTTAEHPFWSETRQDFVEAGKPEIGEEVLALSGQRTRLSDITPRAGPETVYNFEVANQHVYYVGTNGLLVHNAKAGIYISETWASGSFKKFLFDNGISPTAQLVKKAKRLGGEHLIHGHHIVMKGAWSGNKAIRVAVKKSRAILKRAGIDINNGRNLTHAINGDHSVAYAQSVLRRLQAAERKGENIADALDSIREVLQKGGIFRYP